MPIHAKYEADETGAGEVPRQRRRWCIVLLLLGTALAGALLIPIPQRQPEPIYAGKTLTAWLLNPNAGTVWIPNDVYAHIHDELWYRLVEQDSETNITGPVSWKVVPPPADRAMAVRQIGTNGIPRLIQLISERETSVERIREAIADRLPARVGEFIYPDASRVRAQWQNVAGFDGFTILGANAEPALPALSNLLFQGREHLQLTWAIANIGPKGIAVLTNALGRTNGSSREAAALALGLKYQLAKSAVPALVYCVERGDAGYDVLGALGRIGCDDPRLVPALMRLLETDAVQANPKVDTGMAFLLLGLQREKARTAAPLVIAEYRLLMSDTNAAANRRFYRRILQSIAPDLVSQLPPRRHDEESDSWP